VQQVQADTGQAAGQIRPEGLPVLPQADVQRVERLLPVAEMVQGEGGAVQAVVEAGAGAAGRVGRPVDQPLLQARLAAGPRYRQRVQHAGRAVRQAEAANRELLGVAGEEPVVPVRRRAGHDGAYQVVAQARPGRPVRLDFRVRGRRFPGQLARRRDDLHRRGQKVLRYAEMLGDDLGVLHGLGPVQPQQVRHGQEQREAQARQGVPVDVEARQRARRGEALVAEPGAAGLAGVRSDLEVEQGDRTFAHHDVEQVQVAVDEAPFVDRVEGGLDLAVDAHGPVGVPGGVVGSGGRVGQRVPQHDGPAQHLAVDELHRQEAVLAQPEQVVHLRDARNSRQPPQDVVLAFEPAYGVVAVTVQAGVRPPFLEDDLVAGAGVAADVDPAAVGEVHHPLDRVRQAVDLHGIAGGEVGGEKVRQCHPRRDIEHRIAPVRHQRAIGAGDRRYDLAAVVHDVLVDNRAVPDVKRTGTPPQVAENVRARLAVKRVAELPKDRLTCGFVRRIDGDQLAAVSARCVFGNARGQRRRRAEKLEVDAARHAVVPYRVEYPVGVIGTRRHVDLPALGRQMGVA
jgi:hypothetical protein